MARSCTLLGEEPVDHSSRRVRLLQLREIPGALNRCASQVLVRGDEGHGGGGVGEAWVIAEDKQSGVGESLVGAFGAGIVEQPAMVDDGKAGRSIFRSRAEGLTALRDGVLGRASDLRALETARARVEGRYLDGHPALFPVTARSWTEQRERTDTLAEITVRLAEFEGLPPLPADDPGDFEARVSELVADHVEPARVKALDEVGEGRRAVSIAMAWLEPKLR